ncbi:hypothetical protein PIB30_008497 [Stylosanthes scabra]|uniref:Uncharacterized protein n=1 Tax=Stylosanthes scabra TaxID=79078 RepID=A0ABU6Y221_9FABA|nr:hypothetical protein [Stylosanthes scabra]
MTIKERLLGGNPIIEETRKGCVFKQSSTKVLPELIIQVDDDILSPCALQIKARKWEKFTNPIQAVGHNMVKEFYANAWEPDKEKRKPYTYTTMVRERYKLCSK